MKYIKIAILVILVLIIVITASIIYLIKKTSGEIDYEAYKYGDVEKVTSEATFYKINNTINKYFEYVFEKNTQAIEAMTTSDVKNIIDIFAQYNTEAKFDVKTIYSIDKVYYATGFIYGRIAENEYYLIINLDYDNKTFSIVHSNKQEYENAINNIVDEKYRKDIEIPKNKYNEIVNKNITDFEILTVYFEDYKYKALNNPEIAFNLLDSEYKEKKFNNDIDLYKEYVEKNKDRFKDANIVKHGITKDGQYRQYICIDNYGNYYEFNEVGIKEYTVILDNYTLESDEFINKYNKLSDKEKAISNVDKVMKLINEKNYTELYGHLSEGFKNNYFSTQETFEKYIQNNFFDNNITGTITVKNEGKIFMITVPYKEGLSSAAEQRKKTFIVRLGEGTDFELSFNVD